MKRFWREIVRSLARTPPECAMSSVSSSPASRRLANGATLFVVGGRPGKRQATRLRLGEAFRVIVAGILVVPAICALLALAYYVKTAAGLDLMNGPSPIHDFLDNIRQTELL